MSNVNTNFFVSSIFKNCKFYLQCYFLRHRNSPFEEIQLSVNCYISVFNFHQNTKSTTVLSIYRILEKCPKAFLIMFRIDVNRLTLPRHPQGIIFEHIFKNAFPYLIFSILTTGKHIDMYVNM